MTVRERMKGDLVAAMKRRDTVAVAVLRNAIAALANAEAVDPADHPRGATEVARRELTDAEVRAVLAGEHDELCSVREELRAAGRDAEAEDLDRRASILADYL